MRRSHDFEPELLARITHPGRVHTPRRRYSRRRGGWWWQVPLVACIAALLAGVWWLRPGGHDAALGDLARETAAVVQGGDLRALSEYAVTTADPAVAEELRLYLADIQEYLDAEGVNLSDATPLAYGGARARVSQPGSPGGGVWASVGNVYLDADGTLVAVEYASRRANRTYHLTDVWSAQVLGQASLAAAETHAREAYRTFVEQDSAAGVEARFRSTRFVFVPLR